LNKPGQAAVCTALTEENQPKKKEEEGKKEKNK